VSDVREIRTERLILRDWRDEDLPAFAAMNADPQVMEYMPALLTRAESDAMVGRIRELFAARGFGLWAVELAGGAPFIGYVGLSVPRFQAAFVPCVEIGWRLSKAQQGLGLATEAARAVLAFGFQSAALHEIVSFTVPENRPSRRVMEKIGMTHDPDDDFNHPSLASGHRLCRHVLYRLTKVAWQDRVARE
jgi:RimJ/RimL family protein N-acetyltransferase